MWVEYILNNVSVETQMEINEDNDLNFPSSLNAQFVSKLKTIILPFVLY
jgi:hypothetical protein